MSWGATGAINVVGAAMMVLLLAGCVNVKPLAEVGHGEYGSELTCKKPYTLARYCSWGHGRYRVVIEDFDIDLAFSEDGRIVLVSDAHQDRHAFFSNPLVFNAPGISKAVNKSYVLVRKVIDDAQIEVQQVHAIKRLGTIDSYLLELNGDGFSVLSQYGVQKKDD